MKKMKKILAMLLALTMVLGMGLTSMAAPEDEGETVTTVAPTENDKTKVSVSGLESDSLTVTAYQIVDGYYNNSGFVEYVSVAVTNDMMPMKLVGDPLAPTAEEVFSIAKNISDGKYTTLTNVKMNEITAVTDDEVTTYTYSAKLNAGYWIVLVSGGFNVYNPMLVSAYYTVGGSDNTLAAGNVTADDEWNLDAQGSVAKVDDTLLTKGVNGATWNLGDKASYVVTALIPQYADSYEKITFVIKDEVKDNSLSIIEESIKVYVDSASEKNIVNVTDYNVIKKDDQGFEFKFDDSWIRKNANRIIMVTYDAEIIGDLYVEKAHDNIAKLIYSTDPTNTKEITAQESVYTFKIDGLVKKVHEVKKDDGSFEMQGLDGAEFTLFTDENCKTPYKNSKYKDGCVIKSNQDGMLETIYGLNEGRYYLKETKAPSGFSINDTVYKIEIKAGAKDDSTKTAYYLTSLTITITPNDGTDAKVYTYTKNAEGKWCVNADAQLTMIVNTALIDLPSTGGIGTTIFTVAGCGIMIAAAFFFFASRKKENE